MFFDRPIEITPWGTVWGSKKSLIGNTRIFCLSISLTYHWLVASRKDFFQWIIPPFISFMIKTTPTGNYKNMIFSKPPETINIQRVNPVVLYTCLVRSNPSHSWYLSVYITGHLPDWSFLELLVSISVWLRTMGKIFFDSTEVDFIRKFTFLNLKILFMKTWGLRRVLDLGWRA